MLGSISLNIRSIISKLKLKYEVDSSTHPDDLENKYVKLLYLKELNAEFINLQKEYENLQKTYFA
jgi:hypothetical protein